MNALKTFRRSVAISSLMFVPGLEAVSKAATVVVTPGNLNGWTLNTFDDNGNVATSDPYDLGTAAMVTGPATPPLGVGSAHLATAPGGGDGAAAIAIESFDGTPLSSITSLSYYTYDVTNNGQQFPYLAISFNTGAIDNTDDAGASANTVDTMFFEPPYQQPVSGNPVLPDQGATAMNEWQGWNASVGGFWDNYGFVGNPGTPEDSTPGVMPLSAYVAAYPDATIVNGGLPGLGGIAMQVGFAGPDDNFDGYVDDFTIGVNGVNTTYNFEPNAVPEPASTGLLLVGAAAALMRRRRRTS